MAAVATDSDGVLDKWNFRSAPYPSDSCLQDLFWEQAAKSPNSIAVDDPVQGLRLTYREFDDLTDRLASVLYYDHGVRPDTVVGIFMERSAEFVISYVSILKAGGAYMPLELVYPKNMLSRALAQTKCPVVLTKSVHEQCLPDDIGVKKFLLDGPQSIPTVGDLPAGAVIPVPQGGFDERPHPDNLAFVVMSSGTTGKPKAICQVHRSAVHSYHDRFERFPYHVNKETNMVEDRVGAGVFFVWELMRPLLRGATCTVIPNNVIFDPEACTQFILDHNITRILFTPSLLQLIMDIIPTEEVARRLASLRMCWLCGEVVTTQLAQSFTSCLPDCELLNLYSISECHDATIGDLKRDLDVSQKYATCGKNIPNVRLYVVEVEDTHDPNRPHLKRLAAGEVGEVFVGGPVLAREYLEMPKKTAERFVLNPFNVGTESNISSSRLYRTGDLGRVLPDTGELEIIGRCDFMVKIRGYSVVLGAVESAVAEHPMVASAVAITEGEEGTDKRVVSYVVPKVWGELPSAANLRAFLKDKLPPYAVPSVFYILDKLPVNDNAAGKLDRKRLPAGSDVDTLPAFLEGDDAALKRVAPVGGTECSILEIMSNLLGTSAEELSVTDSFFEIGGHSLLATRLVTQLIESLGVHTLTLGDVVAYPATRDLARRVDELLVATDGSDGKNIPATVGTVIDLLAEAEMIDPSIYPAATRKSRNLSRFRQSITLLRPRTVFLTGATGWLGAHLLQQLIVTDPHVIIVCLVRAKDEESGLERLVKTLKDHQLFEKTLEVITQYLEDESEAINITQEEAMSIFRERVQPVCGDLSKPMLGLGSDLFKGIAGEIDAILHCGAAVNLVKPYSALKSANVLGTQEALRLSVTNGATMTKVKPFYYVSTNGIFPIAESAYDVRSGESKGQVVCEEDVDLEKLHANLDEGYGMTKWVAEKMCSTVESKGLPVHIMRPGNMAGSTVTGAQNQNDFVFLFLSAVIELGAAPSKDMGLAYAFDLTPVDFAAAAAVHFVMNPLTSLGKRVHLQNPHPPITLDKIVAQLREVGHTIVDVSRDEWLKKMHEHASSERQKDSKSSSVMQRVEAGFQSFEVYFRASTWMTYGCNNLALSLQGSGINCPEIDSDLLSKWFPCS